MAKLRLNNLPIVFSHLDWQCLTITTIDKCRIPVRGVKHYSASFLLTPVFLNIGWWTKATPSDPSLPPSYLRGWSVWDTSLWSEAILYFSRLFSSALAHGQMPPLVLLPPRECPSVHAKASYNLLTQDALHYQWWRWTKCCPKGCSEMIIDNDIDKWCPFHTPCLELCILFNCYKCTVSQIGINHKNRTFSRLYN